MHSLDGANISEAPTTMMEAAQMNKMVTHKQQHQATHNFSYIQEREKSNKSKIHISSNTAQCSLKLSVCKLHMFLIFTAHIQAHMAKGRLNKLSTAANVMSCIIRKSQYRVALKNVPNFA